MAIIMKSKKLMSILKIYDRAFLLKLIKILMKMLYRGKKIGKKKLTKTRVMKNLNLIIKVIHQQLNQIKWLMLVNLGLPQCKLNK